MKSFRVCVSPIRLNAIDAITSIFNQLLCAYIQYEYRRRLLVLIQEGKHKLYCFLLSVSCPICLFIGSNVRSSERVQYPLPQCVVPVFHMDLLYQQIIYGRLPSALGSVFQKIVTPR